MSTIKYITCKKIADLLVVSYKVGNKVKGVTVRRERWVDRLIRGRAKSLSTQFSRC